MREDNVILPDGRLESILKKKENGVHLKNEEIKTAMRLIDRAVPTGGGICWMCEERKEENTPAIFDTGLCKKHAHEVLLEKDT
jgi:hypothetical protein